MLNFQEIEKYNRKTTHKNKLVNMNATNIMKTQDHSQDQAILPYINK